jgi:hypothetical protein
MLVDWLEFSVEHLSKWWNALRVWEYPKGGNQNLSMLSMVVLPKIQNYLHNNVHDPPLLLHNERPSNLTTTTTHLQKTIAIIAFLPYAPL